MKTVKLFTAIFVCAIILFTGCGPDEPKPIAKEVLTLGTNLCILDYKGTFGDITYSQASVNLTSGSDWTLTNYAGSSIEVNITEGKAGNYTIKLNLTQDFVTAIEGGSSLFSSGIVGFVRFENESAARELMIYYHGKGTAESPRLITTAVELQAIKDNLARHYLLMCDLMVSSWLPLGDGTNKFTGSINGGGHVVILNGFSLAVPDNHYGLIGVMEDALVKNLHVVANSTSTLKTDDGVIYGGIAGHMSGNSRIECSRVSGRLAHSHDNASGSTFAGGIVGRMSNASVVTNCVSDAVIDITSGRDACVGGLVGVQSDGTVSYSYAIGTVTAAGKTMDSTNPINVGGLVGSPRTVSNCVALCGKVTGDDQGSGNIFIGRVVGRDLGTYSNNYANSAMTLIGGTVTGGTATGKDGAGVTLTTTQSQNWWSSTSGFTFSSAAWKWDENTKMPKLYWEE